MAVGPAGTISIGHAEGNHAGRASAVDSGIVAGATEINIAQGGLVVAKSVGAREGEYTTRKDAGDGASIGEAKSIPGHRIGKGDAAPGNLGVINIGKRQAGLDCGGGTCLGVRKTTACGNYRRIVNRCNRDSNLHCSG